MSEKPTTPTRRRWARRAAVFGAVLGLLCSALPPDYRAACQAVATICTGGIAP